MLFLPNEYHFLRLLADSLATLILVRDDLGTYTFDKRNKLVFGFVLGLRVLENST